MRSSKLAATLFAAGTLALPAIATAKDTPPPAPSKDTVSNQSWTLQANKVQTFTMPMKTLQQKTPTSTGPMYGIEEPCVGFDISGPGIAYAASDIDYYGWSEPSEFDAGVDPAKLGYITQPDGSLWKPDSAIKLPAVSESQGRVCQARGWDFSAQVKPSLRKTRTRGADSRIARRKGKHTILRHSSAQPVQVLFAGKRANADGTFDLVVRVSTGDLPGPTTLSSHARVAQVDIAAEVAGLTAAAKAAGGR